ncbi:MAG: NAD-dependent epimerase/dehydratase family protein [Syntrophaceae bacterium]|nr:NAD-dependent epimerase/dehydratase family protein [Syntrophaceae bacterium]
MNYLITGATGFIGPYLLKKLTAGNHVCRCLVRPGSEKKIPDLPGIEVVFGDITQPESLAGVADHMDCLLHMATLGHMSNFTVTEEMFNAINVQGTVNIMNEALRAGVGKIVHCSTVAAMGICDDVPSTETTPCKPHHAYGRSKLKAEQEVKRLVIGKGLPAAIVRFSMVYGPGDPRDILKLTRMAKKGLFPKVGNRPKLTPLIHAEDAAEGLLLAATKGKPGEIYLMTNKNSEPFDKIREIIQEALGKKKRALYVPEWTALTLAAVIEKLFTFVGKTPPLSRKNMESTLADRVFSIEKAAGELGFDPKVDPVQGLRETVLWYKEKGWI